MVREKSVLLPLPLNRAGVDDSRVVAYVIRSLGASPGFCWYQDRQLLCLTAGLVLQVRVTLDPAVKVSTGG